MTVGEVYAFLQNRAPFETAEAYDNAGLLVGSAEMPADPDSRHAGHHPRRCTGGGGTGRRLIVSHHPVIFHPAQGVCRRDSVPFLLASNRSLQSAPIPTWIEPPEGSTTFLPQPWGFPGFSRLPTGFAGSQFCRGRCPRRILRPMWAGVSAPRPDAGGGHPAGARCGLRRRGRRFSDSSPARGWSRGRGDGRTQTSRMVGSPIRRYDGGGRTLSYRNLHGRGHGPLAAGGLPVCRGYGISGRAALPDGLTTYT